MRRRLRKGLPLQEPECNGKPIPVLLADGQEGSSCRKDDRKKWSGQFPGRPRSKRAAKSDWVTPGIRSRNSASGPNGHSSAQRADVQMNDIRNRSGLEWT